MSSWSSSSSARATTAHCRTRGMRGEHDLDLLRLDAVAVDLHLIVDAAEKLDVSVGQRAHPVACAIEPTSLSVGEGIGKEVRSWSARAGRYSRERRRRRRYRAHRERRGQQASACGRPRTRTCPATDDPTGTVAPLWWGRPDLERAGADRRFGRPVVVQDAAGRSDAPAAVGRVASQALRRRARATGAAGRVPSRSRQAGLGGGMA